MFTSGYYGIYRSYMDGSNVKAILTGSIVSGIIVDSESDRLYWISGKQVKSCLRDGSEVETAVQLGSNGTPWGLTKLNGVIYWGSGGTGSRDEYWAELLLNPVQPIGPVHLDWTGLKSLTGFLGLDWMDKFLVVLDGLDFCLKRRRWTGLGWT